MLGYIIIKMFSKILVVCIGNICRSPIGEVLLKKYTTDKIITSAGISAVVGSSADPKAEIVAQENDLTLVGHRARQLTKEICRENELILVMEKEHLSAVYRIEPTARGKVMLFGHWISKEVGDPYQKNTEIFRYVFHQLDEAATNWARALNS